MTIYKKPDLKVFGANAKPTEIAEFEDLLRGWGVTIEKTNGIPPMEWFNYLFNRLDGNINYILQNGITEYDTNLEYPQNAVVKSGGKLYLCLRQNTNKPLSNGTYWELLIKNATTSQKGVVQLSSSVTSTDETKASTPKAVKVAYDKGVQADNNANKAQQRADSAYDLASTKENKITRSNSVTSSSTSDVATSLAVKTAYDKAVQADNNANSRVSKAGDTMTGNLEINRGTYSGLILGAGSHNNKLIIENNDNALSNSSILNIILRKNGYSGDNHSMVSIPNKNGQVLLDAELSSSVESNNKWIPANSLAVKTAYDKAVQADNNANSRVSKAGDIMTGNLEIRRSDSDYSEIKLRNNANKDLYFGGLPDNDSSIGNIIYRDVASSKNISLIRIPKKNGTMLLDSHFTGSISKNGWSRLPNGLIMQWLTFTSPCSSKRSWPIAFTQIFNVTASQVMIDGSNYVQNYDQDIFYTTTQVWGHRQKEVRVFAVGI